MLCNMRTCEELLLRLVCRSEAELKLTKRQTLREQALHKTLDVRDARDASTHGAVSLLALLLRSAYSLRSPHVPGSMLALRS